jgi:hypothetical protein
MTERTLSPVTHPGTQNIAPEQVCPGAVHNGHAPVELYVKVRFHSQIHIP